MSHLSVQADYDPILKERLVDWKPDQVGTLMFVRQASRVLLIRKKRGHGAGLFNAPGGKLEPDETPLQGAIRETREEVGIEVFHARQLGRFQFVDLSAPQWFGHVFLAGDFAGTPEETDEAVPVWFAVDALPFDQMWQDDRYWLPRLLAGERLTGAFLFDDGRLLTHRLVGS